MKPIRIEFKGVNSFSEMAVIDFEGLLSDGLFGIFGRTGSGKSTILDCIMFALFGKTPRSHTLSDFVNDRSDSASVDFTFETLSEGSRKRFEVRRSVKLNKRGEASTEAVLFEIKGQDVYPLEEKVTRVDDRIGSIIGVGYDEFSKCIILPQNEFAAFVKATRTVRLSLVCKLFSLEKYDYLLNNALKARKASAREKVSKTEGELIRFDGLTKEYLDALYAEICAKEGTYRLAEENCLAAEKKLSGARNAYSVYVQKEENEKKLALLEGRKPETDVLKEKIKRGTLAREAYLCCKAANDALAILNENEKTLSKKSEEAAKLALLMKKTESELQRDRPGEISRLSGLIGELNANKGVVEAVENLRKEYVLQRSEIAAQKGNEQRLMREKGDLLKNIELIGTEDGALEKLFALTGGSAVKGEIKEHIEYFKKKREELVKHKESELYPIVDGEMERRINELQARLAAMGNVSLDGAYLLEALQKIRAANAKLAEYRELLSGVETKLAVAEQKIKSAEEKTAKALAEGEEKKKALSELSEKAGMDISSSSVFRAALDKLKDEHENLRREHANLLKDLSDFSEKNTRAEAELSALREKISALRSDLKAKSEAAAEKLRSGSFSGMEEAARYALDEGELSEYNKRAEEYDKALSFALATRENLLKKLEGTDFDPAAYLELSSQKDSYIAQKEEIRANLAVLKARLNEAEENLKLAKTVRARLEAETAELGLCERLEKVLANHNLLNFIAEEYLAEISAGASATLLMLTSGRYDVVYDGEFFVSDNLNCGELRPVSTLSGGETFLVSLSLALSLSQAICEKSLRPVEFFFLDEGFGTLDTDLTEVVLDSLDKLRSEHFAIGLISHVPELKQRIQAKILVAGATAKEGSKIEVVY